MANPLFAALYDRAIAGMEDAGLRALRAELLSDIAGRVLEVGAGTGLNLPHYPPTVTHLVLTDPSSRMLRRLRPRVRTRGPGFPIEVVRSPAQRLPFDDGTFDEVVVTLVLCSAGNRVAALNEIGRVLRPGGGIRFIEHVAATPRGPSRLQRLMQPLQRALVDGCRLDHVIEASLTEAGFTIEVIRTISLPKAPPWNRPARLGRATLQRED